MAISKHIIMNDKDNPNNDITGNAPMIPRAKFIEALNKIQELQTQMLIVLNQYAPEHFKETERRADKVAPPVWAESSTGLPQSEVVSTTT
jgi:hypothetical protein